MSQERSHLWLRDEVKLGEKRTAIPPSLITSLKEVGYTITVEKSQSRIFPDAEYEKQGCTLVEPGSWKTAPTSAIIVGLKELPEEKSPLVHTHIYFGHCYKNQGGWSDLLSRFDRGNGKLLDLEFLSDQYGRRVAAFGRPAGIAGCALGILLWVHQQLHPNKPFPAPVQPWMNEDKMMEDVNSQLAKLEKKPRVMVIGALGRCGQGCVHVLNRAGLTESATLWDLEETKVGGPFPQMLKHDILLNCIYLSGPIPPFITKDLISQAGRTLSVIVDVSCDTSNPNNPLPIYTEGTTLSAPTLRISNEHNCPLDVISIDHLPTLLPAEASTAFAKDLLPSLIDLQSYSEVWKRAEKIYHDKVNVMRSITSSQNIKKDD